jgi:hypothetical protein
VAATGERERKREKEKWRWRCLKWKEREEDKVVWENRGEELRRNEQERWSRDTFDNNMGKRIGWFTPTADDVSNVYFSTVLGCLNVASMERRHGLQIVCDSPWSSVQAAITT